jgi:hypothetical protein
MYIFDPQQGRRRRELLAAKAEHALSSTGEVLGTTIHGASDSAHAVAKKISSYAHHLAENLSDDAHEAVESGQRTARGYVAKARRRADELHRGLMDRAGSLLSRQEPESHPALLATEITAATVGVLGLGAGLMYVFDPAKGRARRAWMRDKVVSITRQTGREARHYGRHLGNRMKGYAAGARRAVPWQNEPVPVPRGVGSSQR